MILEGIKEAVRDGARVARACEIVGLSERAYQRWNKDPDGGEDRRKGPTSPPVNQLTEEERVAVVETLNSWEFRNQSPKQVVPILAERGTYIASESSMYRILKEEGLNAHRAASRPPRHTKPREFVAQGPGEVLTWDITYLHSPVRGAFFYLYLVVDVWSRKILGGAVHDAESSAYASALISTVIEENGLSPETVVVHMDNGSPMKGATLRATLEALGVQASYSRPHVSNDNPYSESLFRTLKYRPEYPSKPFQSLEAAQQQWVAGFEVWYNTQHRHSAIGYVTPEQRHSGVAHAVLARRRQVYEAARRRNPARWTGDIRRWEAPDVVYLNPEDPLNTVTARSASRPAEAVA
ncbi:MAG: Integrase core domain protein [Planctomycetes bacterium ADurb.Bin069]|nr:MAG: Integrase core domain protein [Planctomycetes bacterium ADurb.Bin069]